MINVVNKSDCNGCAACYSVCSTDCISMTADNEGFLYPSVNKENCTECGLCIKVCPELSSVKEEPVEQKAYLVQHKNNQIRQESTSGGAFTAIAEYIIRHGGVVFGVAYNENFEVIHRSVETIDDLRLFRNSKYVQSVIGETFKECKAHLQKGRLVCYSGTPCQIEGLKKYLKRDYENLITVDLVCHAVPSPFVWKKYLELQNISSEEYSDILFRDKRSYGYKYSTMSIYNKDNVVSYRNGVESDVMLRAFFSDICDRPACYNCSFKKRYRVSDLTIWDCFDVSKFDKNMDDDKGTTRILTQSSKGVSVMAKLNDALNIKVISVDQAINGVREMFKSVPQNPKREAFFIDLNNLPSKDLFEKYFPNSLKSNLERYARLISYKLGVYQQMKKMVKFVYPNQTNSKR